MRTPRVSGVRASVPCGFAVRQELLEGDERHADRIATRRLKSRAPGAADSLRQGLRRGVDDLRWEAAMALLSEGFDDPLELSHDEFRARWLSFRFRAVDRVLRERGAEFAPHDVRAAPRCFEH